MQSEKNFTEAPPKAGAMIEALRGIGYNTATAMADIVDNSIAAGAKRISLNFIWAGTDSRIEVLDDGIGMTPEELDVAMRLGEINPKEMRKEGDLGRFGLGLKTASFSQCKRLTVASRKQNKISILHWDLDVIERDDKDRWLLLTGAPSSISKNIDEKLATVVSGTLVCWEVLDRIITPKFNEQDFLDLIDVIEAHLAMVFHRFLDGTFADITLNLNGREVRPWDPFMDGNLGKPWHAPATRHPLDNEVEIECHVLPHKDMLTEQDFIRYQGPDGWTAQQGFYVYRGGRMLVSGSWLGLGRGRLWTKDEAHRLARIRLDIPITRDSEWKIDIKKASARPPIHLRDWLVKMAELTRHRARRVFAHRGHVNFTKMSNSNSLSQAWSVSHSPTGTKYRINHEHPAVRAVLDNAGDLVPTIKAMLEIIQETVPIQRIWLDTEEGKETPNNRFTNEPPENLLFVLKELFHALTEYQGLSKLAAINQLKHTDPFQEHSKIIDTLIDGFDDRRASE